MRPSTFLAAMVVVNTSCLALLLWERNWLMAPAALLLGPSLHPCWGRASHGLFLEMTKHGRALPRAILAWGHPHSTPWSWVNLSRTILQSVTLPSQTSFPHPSQLPHLPYSLQALSALYASPFSSFIGISPSKSCVCLILSLHLHLGLKPT